MMLSSLDSLLGSIWFAGLTFVVGYIAGQIVPLGKLAKILGRK